MNLKRLQIPLMCVLFLSLAVLACNFENYRSTPTPESAPPVVTEENPPGVPATEVPTEEVIATEEMIPPAPGWLPDGTVALFASGDWTTRTVYALNADGSTSNLGLDVYGMGALSNSGRWLAGASGPSPATAVAITNLETSLTYTIPLTTDYTLYGQAFDAAETRLAFMELGYDGSSAILWTIVVVDLSDGSTTRFDSSFSHASPPLMFPGRPVGWGPGGNELILDTFAPDTEGNWAGVWGVQIPPGTPSAALNTLSPRELIPSGDLYSTPVLSRDGARMLYLGRDFGYTPTDYVVMAYDLAVNELSFMDLPAASGTMLVNAIDGSALMRGAAWSMSGARVLFGQGTYSGSDVFASLTLKQIEPGGAVMDIGPLIIPAGGRVVDLDWCRPGLALTTARNAANQAELSTVTIPAMVSTFVTSNTSLYVLGCVP